MITKLSLYSPFQETLKVPLHAIKKIGPASLTLAGLLSVSTKETFAKQESIAKAAGLPIDTVRKHLAKLQPDWITNNGRQPTKSGRVRRTVTLKPTSLSLERHGYIMIPWWMNKDCNLFRVDPSREYRRHFTWSEKVVFGYIFSKLSKLISAAKNQELADIYGFAIGELEAHGISLRELSRETGLDTKSVIAAKRGLAFLSMIEIYHGDDVDSRDKLLPNGNAVLIQKPAEIPGRSYLFIDPQKGAGKVAT